MSELRSIVASLKAESVADLADAAVEEDLCELQQACEELEAERLRRLAEVECRGLFQRDGHLSVAAWLVSRFGLSWGSARRDARLARALQGMPGTRRAIDEGAIAMDAARALARARIEHPEAFGRDEDQLVETARIHSVADLTRVCICWSQRVEAAEGGRAGDEALRARRNLHASVTFRGMVRVDGDLDPETGETFLSALGAILDGEARSRTEDDVRSPAQRRADALGELCRQWLDRSDRPEVAGERPHMNVTAALGALAGGGVAELDRAGVVPAEAAERIACDAAVRRVVVSPASEPLDVGRATRASSRPPCVAP